MSAAFYLTMLIGALALLGLPAWAIGAEVRRHRREQSIRQRLIEQAGPILHSARCAVCGGPLSTWDGGLAPLPDGKHAASDQHRRQAVAEYEVSRECLGCRHQFVLWLWSDGANWGFAEADRLAE